MGESDPKQAISSVASALQHCRAAAGLELAISGHSTVRPGRSALPPENGRDGHFPRMSGKDPRRISPKTCEMLHASLWAPVPLLN